VNEKFNKRSKKLQKFSWKIKITLQPWLSLNRRNFIQEIRLNSLESFWKKKFFQNNRAKNEKKSGNPDNFSKIWRILGPVEISMYIDEISPFKFFEVLQDKTEKIFFWEIFLERTIFHTLDCISNSTIK